MVSTGPPSSPTLGQLTAGRAAGRQWEAGGVSRTRSLVVSGGGMAVEDAPDSSEGLVLLGRKMDVSGVEREKSQYP